MHQALRISLGMTLMTATPALASSPDYTGDWGVVGMAEPITHNITALAQQPWLHGSMVAQTFRIQQAADGTVSGQAFYGIPKLSGVLTGRVIDGNLVTEADLYQGKSFIGTVGYVGRLSAESPNKLEGTVMTTGPDPDMHTPAFTMGLRNLVFWALSLQNRVRTYEDRAWEIHVAALNLGRWTESGK